MGGWQYRGERHQRVLRPEGGERGIDSFYYYYDVCAGFTQQTVGNQGRILKTLMTKGAFPRWVQTVTAHGTHGSNVISWSRHKNRIGCLGLKNSLMPAKILF